MSQGKAIPIINRSLLLLLETVASLLWCGCVAAHMPAHTLGDLSASNSRESKEKKRGSSLQRGAIIIVDGL